jgi:hypothetical protein
LGDELFVVRAVFGELGQLGTEFAVLLQMSFVRFAVEVQDGVGPAERVQQRPVE